MRCPLARSDGSRPGRRDHRDRPGGLVWAVVALLIAAGLVVWPVGVGADPALDLVDRSRRAGAETDFGGTVRMAWDRPGGAIGQAEVPVSGRGGKVSVGRAGPAPSGPVPMGPDEMVTTWFRSPRSTPPVTDKYQLQLRGGGTVAGRPVDTVEFSLRGQVVERVAADRATGLVLRRETVAEDGRVVRRMEFVRVEVLGGGRPAPPARADPAPVTGQRAPSDLPGGYRVVAVAQHGGVTQNVYSDGLRTLSVFEQRGAMDDTRRVKLSPVPERVGRARAQKYAWAGGAMLVWSDGRVTTAVVGDGPEAEVVEAARAIPEGSRSGVERAAEVARHLLDLLG